MSPLCVVPAAIVNTRNASFRPRNMIQDCFDDMRADSQICHACRAGPAKIVKSPMWDFAVA